MTDAGFDLAGQMLSRRRVREGCRYELSADLAVLLSGWTYLEVVAKHVRI
jgi:hypothetical protein